MIRALLSRNRGYYFEEEAKVNVLEPWTGDGGGRRRRFAIVPQRLLHLRSTAAVGSTSCLPPIWHPLNSFLWRRWPLSPLLPSMDLRLLRWERRRERESRWVRAWDGLREGGWASPKPLPKREMTTKEYRGWGRREEREKEKIFLLGHAFWPNWSSFKLFKSAFLTSNLLNFYSDPI